MERDDQSDEEVGLKDLIIDENRRRDMVCDWRKLIEKSQDTIEKLHEAAINRLAM